MKAMTCAELGGACEKIFRANTFDEMAQLSQQHGKEMFQLGDQLHIEAMNKMRELMKSPAEMKKWFDDRKRQFDLSAEV